MAAVTPSERRLGIFFIVWGLLGFVWIAAMLATGSIESSPAAGSAREANGPAPWEVNLVMLGIGVVLAAPNVLAGIGLMRGARWSRPLALTMAVLSLFVIPVGTALGVYAIWVLSGAGSPQQQQQTVIIIDERTAGPR